MIPTTNGSGIFISYRRDDAAAEAGRLSGDLQRALGEGSVFLDVDGIQPGSDFRKAIHDQVGGCAVLLAVIGPQWSTVAASDATPRLQQPNDYVRLEIATALQRGIPVIPVLVRGAHLPKADALPDNLQDMVYRNSVELNHARWQSDVGLLVTALEKLVKPRRSPHKRTLWIALAATAAALMLALVVYLSQRPSGLTWTDPSTGLMWAKKDTGHAVNWDEAAAYCKDLRLSGFSDWRLPSIIELKDIYDPNVLEHGDKGEAAWHIKGDIQLTGWPWSDTQSREEREAKQMWRYGFNNGCRYSNDVSNTGNSSELRALCVHGPERVGGQFSEDSSCPE